MSRFFRLSRITTGGKFVPEIDGLRFVAIGSVVLFHILGFLLEHGNVAPQSAFYEAIANGSRGVSLFFVISGFILGIPFAEHYLCGGQRVSLRKYYLRRLTRLEPPYVLNLIICAVLLAVVNHKFYLTHLLAGLFYLHSAIFGSLNPVNTVTWSLEVEVQFYCLVPILTMLYRIRPAWFRRALFIAFVPLAGLTQLHIFSPRFALSLGYFIQFFVTGMLLADLYVSKDWRGIPKAWWWDVMLLGWPVVFLASASALRIWIPLLVLALYVSVFKGIISNRIFCAAPIPVVGGMCYSIYLFHAQAMSFVFKLTHKITFGIFNVTYLVQCLFIIPVVLLVCGTYFIFIERPCMRPDWVQRAIARIRSQEGTTLESERLLSRAAD